MLRFVAAGLIVTLTGTVVAQEALFRSDVRIVPVMTTVIDNDGRLVANLTREDFTILDNGEPQELTVFLNAVTPFTVVVMLDFSLSMTENLDRLKAATVQFLLRMLPEDLAQVGSFSDKIQLSGTFLGRPGGLDELIAALDDLQFGNPTKLYDAIDVSLDILEGIQGRKVVLVFSDGEDTASQFADLGDVRDRARNNEVMVYAIGLEVDYFNGLRQVRSRPDRGLQRLAEETGGGYFELRDSDDLASTFTRVMQELHSQYTLGFTPSTLDGREHDLEVRLREPGMTARARQSYIASPDRLTDQP
jgi:Ca-activated chloride channel family protein